MMVRPFERSAETSRSDDLEQANPKAACTIKCCLRLRKDGGARRDRTADLVIANDALSQLSYGPNRSSASAKA